MPITPKSATPAAVPAWEALRLKVRALFELLKFRLSLLVALSAMFGYALASPDDGLWHVLALGLGGMLVTGASNALNQLFEKDLDARMQRTAKRPLPTGRLSATDTLVFAVAMAVAGVAVLGGVFNLPAALLAIIGLLSYAFVYTPLKRHTPFAVFVGAIPGGLPPLIGWVAHTGRLDWPGLLIFAFQFFWQFPHFWAIAWVLHDDYIRAGFKMLPSAQGRTAFSALTILLYASVMVLLPVFPLLSGHLPWWAAAALAALGGAFWVPAFQLYRACHTPQAMGHARRLMFASFLYLPAFMGVYLLAG